MTGVQTCALPISDTNVEDGVYASRGSGGQYGLAGRGLRAGGFDNAVMDTDWDTQASSAPVTSRHNALLSEESVIWGNSSIGSGAGKACASFISGTPSATSS